jgi:MFS family permease
LISAVGLLLASDSFAWLLIWNLLLGCGHVASIVAQQSVVAQGQDSGLEHRFGLYTFYGTLGQAGGPFILAVIGHGHAYIDIQQASLAAACPSAIACILAAALAIQHRSRLRVRQGANVGDLGLADARGRRRHVAGAMATSMALLVMIDIVVVYLPAWGIERGIAAGTVAALLMVRSLAMTISRLFLRLLVTRLRRAPLLVASMAGSAVTVALLLLPLPEAAMFIVMAVSGLMLGIGQPLTMALISSAAPRGATGMWLAVRLSGNSAGLLTMPAVAGLSFAALGVNGVFGVASAGLLVLSLAVGRLFRQGAGERDADREK